MDRDRILAELEKLTVSQRKALRRALGGVAPGRDVVEVQVFATAVTVFVRRERTKFWARLTPRGRVIEQKVWAA